MSKRTEALKMLRDMNETELVEHLRLQRRRLFEMRFQQATGQVENHRQIRDIRHEIARTMTMQIELQRVVHAAEPVEAKPAAPAARAPSRARARRAPAAAAATVAEPEAVTETEADDE